MSTPETLMSKDIKINGTQLEQCVIYNQPEGRMPGELMKTRIAREYLDAARKIIAQKDRELTETRQRYESRIEELVASWNDEHAQLVETLQRAEKAEAERDKCDKHGTAWVQRAEELQAQLAAAEEKSLRLTERLAESEIKLAAAEAELEKYQGVREWSPEDLASELTRKESQLAAAEASNARKDEALTSIATLWLQRHDEALERCKDIGTEAFQDEEWMDAVALKIPVGIAKKALAESPSVVPKDAVGTTDAVNIPTPRTDEAQNGSENTQGNVIEDWRWPDFARELERELTIAKGNAIYMTRMWSEAMTALSAFQESPSAGMGGWLSIESAPKDGTVIALQLVDGNWISECHWDYEDGGWFGAKAFPDSQITHWRPVLPTPPAAGEVK